MEEAASYRCCDALLIVPKARARVRARIKFPAAQKRLSI